MLSVTSGLVARFSLIQACIGAPFFLPSHFLPSLSNPSLSSSFLYGAAPPCPLDPLGSSPDLKGKQMKIAPEAYGNDSLRLTVGTSKKNLHSIQSPVLETGTRQ
uniref:Uncharacterized protein n=1 Tax=Setaria viridis TaxID=4556 RepID=A0A4U6V2R6_SETVI|nr:hypothetical protein SEVIR_4G243701v2 [Setaria viridis]